MNIDKANTYVPSGTVPVSKELAVFRERLHGSGLPCERVDLQLLGVGVTGHIGFNEPAAQLTADAHVEELSQSTIEANSRYFDSEKEVPTQALTQGMGDILKAKKPDFDSWRAIQSRTDFPVVKQRKHIDFLPGDISQAAPQSYSRN